MDERLEDLRSAKNPKARIKILKGHFATSHSHINTYIDMSTVNPVTTTPVKLQKFLQQLTFLTQR